MRFKKNRSRTGGRRGAGGSAATLPDAAVHDAAAHNLAVNGVVAGCRPEHMPVLVTIARFTGGGTIGSLFGDDPERVAPCLSAGLVRHTSWTPRSASGPGKRAPRMPR